MSQSRVCELFGAGRSTIRYQSIANDRADIRLRIRNLASSRPRYGYRRLLVFLQRERFVCIARNPWEDDASELAVVAQFKFVKSAR